MKNEWITVLRAADAAARWHVHQRRKGAAAEPYVNHLLEVAVLVAEATEGKDPDLVIAALLHDAMEDQEVPRQTIVDAFGEPVAKMIEEVTDDKTLDRHVRKKIQVDNASKKSRTAKILKLADKTSNLRAIAASPPPRLDRKAPIGIRCLGAQCEGRISWCVGMVGRGVRRSCKGGRAVNGISSLTSQVVFCVQAGECNDESVRWPRLVLGVSG